MATLRSWFSLLTGLLTLGIELAVPGLTAALAARKNGPSGGLALTALLLNALSPVIPALVLALGVLRVF